MESRRQRNKKIVGRLENLTAIRESNNRNGARGTSTLFADSASTSLVKLGFLVSIAVTLCLTIACSNPANLPTETSSNTEIEPGIVVVDESETLEPAPRSTSGSTSEGVLVYAADCGTPDPAISPLFGQTILDGPMASEIHAGLTRIGKRPNLNAEAELAETYSADDDGKTYTFKLRNDLKFSDGSPITATDFKWSWERALNKSRGGGTARFAFEPILGSKEVLEGKKDELEGVQVIDERTLVVHLSEPVAHFPMLLALPVASVVKKENVEQWGVSWNTEGAIVVEGQNSTFTELPVGAGPFRLSHYDPLRNECELSRNDHYWGDPPRIDGVIFHTGTGNPNNPVGQDANLFRQGKIDNISWISSQLEDDGTAGKEIKNVAPTSLGILLFNPTVPPFDNVHARRAIAMVSPNLTGPDKNQGRILTEDMGILSDEVKKLPFAPEAAQTEMLKCECSDDLVGNAIEYVTDLDEGIGPLIFTEWASHLDVSVETIIDHSLSSRVWSGNAELIFMFLEASYPDPSAVLLPLLDAIPGGRDSDLVTEFRDMAKAAITEIDASRRMSLWQELEKRMLDSGVVIPVITVNFEPSHVQEWVHGFEYAGYGRSLFHDVWLEDPPADRTLK